jgi:hypothetical protein
LIKDYFHRWENELAAVSKNDRKVRSFDWGADWIDAEIASRLPDPGSRVAAWVDAVMNDSDAFFTPEPTRYTFTPAPDTVRASGEAGVLTFASGFTTPHEKNNTVVARYFPADPMRGFRRTSGPRRAVVVLAQWNSDAEGHIGLCKLLSKLGIASLRISLPYHDARMPPELVRADYIVSANIVRTLQVCRQAVRDVRLALWWLRDQGYERLGLLGTSLGSCLSYLTTCHEPLVKAQALNHVSPYFADVVWRGLSTEHVRKGLEGHVDADELRHLWRPISPWSFIDRLHDRKTLMVYAKYDLTFPVDLSLRLIDELRRREIPLEVAVLPCGHYSTGAAPFKYLDGWYLGRFLFKNL